MLQEAKRAAAEAEMQRLEAERQAQVAAERAAAEEREALEKKRTYFVFRAEGRSKVCTAPADLMTQGRLVERASIMMEAEAGNLLAGSAGSVRRGASDLSDARVRFGDACFLWFADCRCGEHRSVEGAAARNACNAWGR
jgi:hypothetical protein